MSCQPSHASETAYPELTESVPSGRSFFFRILRAARFVRRANASSHLFCLTSPRRTAARGAAIRPYSFGRTDIGRLSVSTVPSVSFVIFRASSRFGLFPCSIPDGVWQKTKKRGATSIAPRIGDGWFANARSVRLRPAPLLQAPAVAPSGRLRSDWDGPSTSTRRRARSPKGRSSKRARRSRARGCSKSR